MMGTCLDRRQIQRKGGAQADEGGVRADDHCGDHGDTIYNHDEYGDNDGNVCDHDGFDHDNSENLHT